MNLEQILSHILANYANKEIHEIALEMSAGDISRRKLLADLVCKQPAGKMSPAMIYEISKWGINDDLSRSPEFRKKVGRPVGRENNAVVHLRIPMAEKTRWVAQANQEGLKLSAWIRKKCEG